MISSSENIPVEYPGFDVAIYSAGADYYVTLTPAPEPVTLGLLAFGALPLLWQRRKA